MEETGRVTRAFEAERPRLQQIAARVLGDHAEADVLARVDRRDRDRRHD